MKIDHSTVLYGVAGYPLSHTLGPAMHNAAFSAAGLNAIYLAFETLDIEGCIKGIRALDIKGMSITIPYKTSVVPLIDEVDELAGKIGAVNTIINREGHLVGYNTDAVGAIRALEEATTLPGKRCLMIGAGGAARAIGFALGEREVPLTIANRSKDRGEKLASDLGCQFIPLGDLTRIEAEILIQTTPLGMAPQAEKSPIPSGLLERETLVMDAIYNPIHTRLLKDARERGCPTINGVEMFLYQGAEQFELWTGVKPPYDIMREAVLNALGQ
ncbi:MAG: shikimate dehydrogenase [Deltaproteobacteria bacterium]|nr:shikimate dehydrogenase [Deltaproteobacteria bacterium]MBW2136206.1 shikimate dehydrogenase [Deltaproteobacteria bacterium]